jgi:hypothetical protein
VIVPKVKEYCRPGAWLFATIGLVACSPDPVEFSIPAVPARTPIETARLGGNVFESICHIGNPFTVVDWDQEPQTRFLYFVGPFNGAADGLTHQYLYMAIPASDRARTTTTLYLDRLDEVELRKHAKPGELRQFLLPHLAGLSADAKEIERQLGKPSHTRKLKSGLTRLIFERNVCLGGKRLVGVYVDSDGGRVVAAKGVDHPERLKWILSAGRPPQPDERPTYYLDWEPREGSAQAAALGFVFRVEGRDIAGALAQFAQRDLMAQPFGEFATLFDDGSKIDSSTLKYQTTRYELDLTAVSIAFSLSSGRNIRCTMELRNSGNRHWLVSGLRVDGNVVRE